MSQPNITQRRRRRRRQFELKPGTVIILVLVAIAVISILNYYKPPAPITITADQLGIEEEDLLVMPPIVPLEMDDLVGISLSRGGYSFRLEKQADKWYLVKPFKDLADVDQIAYLVENTAGLRFDEEITEPLPLSEYGLDDPILSMEYISNSGQKVTLNVGSPEDSIEWFVKTSESDYVYLLRNLPVFCREVLAEELLSSKLIFVDMDKIKSVTANFGETEKYFEFKNGAWTIDDPELGTTVVFGVSQFIRDLNNLSASSIVSSNLSTEDYEKMGLLPSGQLGTITVKYQDGSETAVNLGYSTDDGKRYYVNSTDRPFAYLVLQLPVENLSQKLEFASNKILALDVKNVTTLIVNPIPQEELDRAAALGKKLPDPPRYEFHDVEGWLMNQRPIFNVQPVVESLTNVPGISRAPELTNDEYGFYPNPSSFNLEVRLKNKARLNVEFGNQTPDGYYYVQSSDHPGEVFLTTSEIYNTIKDTYAGIRSILLPFTAEQVAAIETTIFTSTGVDTRRFTRSGDSWIYNGEPVASGNVTQINTNIINRLIGIKAEKVKNAELSPEEYGFRTVGGYMVKVFLDNGEEYSIEIGKEFLEGAGFLASKFNYIMIGDLPDYVISIPNATAKRITDAIKAIHK